MYASYIKSTKELKKDIKILVLKRYLRVVEWVALIRFLFGMWHY